SIIWDPNPELQKLDLGRASLHHWSDRTGHMWSGILVLPPGYKKGVRYPLVIQTHGYDPNAFFVDGEYTTGSGGRALAAKGIVVLQMEQPPPTTMQTSENGPVALRGFESAIDDLSSAGIIDPDRVGVIGFSFTCYHVLYALTHNPELFAAASITDGNYLSDFQYVLSADSDHSDQELNQHTYGTLPYWKGILPWIKDAPAFNLDRVTTPLLISAFENTSLLLEWEPYAGLRRLGKPVALRWLPTQDSPHVLVQPKHRYASEGSAVDWYSFWLKGEEDSDPNKTQEYERWRRLRPETANSSRKEPTN